MAERITITPQDLRNSAKVVRDKRDEIVEAANTLRSTVDALESSWQGSAQMGFMESFNDLYPTISESFPQLLDSIQLKLDGAAQTMEETDDSIAQQMRG